MQESEDKLKQYEEKYNILKNEKINSENKNNDIENLIEKNNEIIKEKHDLENEIKKIKSDNKNILDEVIKNKSETENKYKQTVKENEKLQEKIKQLTLFQDNIEKDLNEINLKYKETKKILSEKEKELFDLKEASQALIQKEKNHMEQSITVDPKKCKIITDKIYKKLKWYLIYEKKEKDEKKENNDKIDNNTNKEDEENKYENYRWVEGPIIKREDLQKFNKYETDEEKIKDLNEYIINLQ